MNALNTFEGDALLFETVDGGEIAIENGIFVSDAQFSSAVYLSLFGGNQDDPGKVENNKTWWGNHLDNITKSEKMVSRFQSIIIGFPMTVKNIREAEAAAELDLQWLIDDKIADGITATIKSISKHKFNLIIEVLKDVETIFENTYPLQWGG
jgi:phage gp46-like protein